MREMTRVPVRKMAVMNRRVWNHISDNWQKRQDGFHDWRFFRRGGWSLLPPVLKFAGPLRGKRVLDIACGSGESSLSFANKGARVTGVDNSDKRLEQARLKAARAGLKVDYIRANMVRLPFRPSTFDLVFTGGGITAWIPDTRAWGRAIARVLKRGGTFIYSDRHPFTMCVNMSGNRLTLGGVEGGYFDQRPLTWNGMSHWMNRPTVPHVERNWKLDDIMNALSAAGLVFREMREVAVKRHWFRMPKDAWKAFPRELVMSWRKPR